MSNKFFDNVATLDAVIRIGPSSSDYKGTLAHLLEDERLNEYFFTHISDPAWLQVLVDNRKFATVPSLAVNEAERTVGFPAWPQGEYLKKIAEVVPGAVSTVVLHIPATQNARVHDSILQIATSIPAEFAEKLVPKVIEGIQAPYHLTLPYNLNSLISFLAKAGRVPAAFQVAEAALEIFPTTQQAEPKNPTRTIGQLREPAARFDTWAYEQLLLGCLSDLVDSAGERALDLFCRLLDRAILFSDAKGSERRPDDLSHIWRPAIEEHQQNLKMGVRDILVTAVRDAAQRRLEKDPKTMPSLVNQLEEFGKSWWIFRRIVLHLLRIFPAANFALVQDRLLSRALFDSVEVRHEYFLLEKECFGSLSSDDQRVILGWIQGGPQYSDERLKKWEEFTKRSWTEEDKANYVRQWKRDQLAPLEQYLDAEWKVEYARLLTEVGSPSHPDFTSYHEGGAWGPTSPKNRDEFAKMSAAEIVKYLRDWKPAGDFRSASPEGLGRELTALVAEEPEKYAAGCPEFMRLSEPTYLRSIVQGFQDAVKAKRRFAWRPVLDLCVWAVRQNREIPGRVQRFEMDAHWGWTRAAVSRLLTEGFSSEANPIPFELREQAWPGIVAGTLDPEPTPEQEMEYLEKASKGKQQGEGLASATAFDPFTNSMNTPRGVAMEAVVRYALWVRSGFEKLQDNQSLAKGFDAIPEAREILDLHLNPENDPSITIRTVYGQRAPWLHLLDEKWAQENTARIFTRNRPELWHAAWDAYIGYSQPFDKVFDWLRGEYAFAVEQIGSHKHGWSQPQAPDYSLAQHLMSFYWRGKIDHKSEILTAFYSRADAPLRAHVLSFIGRSLRNTKEAIPKEVVDRLKVLWTQMVESAKQRPTLADEFKEYGWWFASSKLDDQWSLAQLLEALRLANRVEPDHLVVERLVALASSMPNPSIQALRMMIEGDSNGWGVLGWTDKAKEIIRTVRKSGDGQARDAADDLVNLLGSRGLFDFGELLKEPV
jgi:hypothetical protein